MRGASLARAVELLREEGAAGLVLRGLRRLGVYQRFELLGGTDRRRPERSSHSVECETLGPERIDEYLTLRPDQSREMILRRLDEGHCGFIGRCEGRVVSASWSVGGRVWLDFLDRELRLAPGVCYSYDTYVVPELRGKRVANAVTNFRRDFMREAGYTRMVAVIERENRSAASRSDRRRDIAVGLIECFRLGPWRHVRLTFDRDDREQMVEISGPPRRA